MSQADFESAISNNDVPAVVAATDTGRNDQQSFLERFLNRFFQEKNIKWMLVVGAGIVFASSLMLVTRAWPSFGPAMKFLTILGYTAATFAAAETGHLRLGLISTWKVLHSLTLLLMPICFLALERMSHGTATQNVLATIEFIGLLIPAMAFLWFASSRILDHLLRGRQTTFLISYQLLCLAGAAPAFVGAVPAFVFMSVCWLIFTVGVVKVNRHTFWLAEEGRVPRVFGFLPIAMLGLQFVILVAIKTIDFTEGSLTSALPLHWIGLGCVMVAATVLLTARTVADVFRQRTGDLVRPLPWTLSAPLLCGLVLTGLGVTLSFSGFSWIGETTWAVIPAAAIAALLMWTTAKDTKHSGFVWAGLIYLTIAYQCSPTLFSNIVQQLKQSAEAALHEDRLPFAFYGLTYLPLIMFVAGASRYFASRSERRLSQPMKHFVTFIAMALFCGSVTSVKALFFVSLVNVPAFIILALVFSDRRYVFPAIGALVMAVGSAVPAFNGMKLTAISSDYIATALAGLAAVLAATRLPDGLLNRIPIAGRSILRHRDSEERLSERSYLLQRADGSDRILCQSTGCLLAVLMGLHCVGATVWDFSTALSNAGLLQFTFLLSALVLYTIRNPHYLSGLCVWTLVAFAAVRHAIGLQFEMLDVINVATLIASALSLASYVWLRWTGRFSNRSSLNEARRALGLDAQEISLVAVPRGRPYSWTERFEAFVVPLCDLCLIALAALLATVQIPLLLKAHVSLLGVGTPPVIMLSTSISVVWMIGATAALRSRVAAVAAAAVTPLWVTAMLTASAFPLTAEWVPVVWVVVVALLSAISRVLTQDDPTDTTSKAVAKVSDMWLQGTVLLSCLFFAWPLRLAAMIGMVSLFWKDRSDLTPSRRSYAAVMSSIHSLLLLAALGGATGFVLTPAGTFVAPLVFLGVAVIVALFDRCGPAFDADIIKTWSALLRPAALLLVLLALAGGSYPPAGRVIMLLGFAAAIFAEFSAAVRNRCESRVWSGLAVAGLTAIFLYEQGMVHFGRGLSQFALLGISVAALATAWYGKQRESLRVMCRPMSLVGQTLPVLVTVMALFRELAGLPSVIQGANSLALLAAAGIYFQQGIVTRQRRYGILSASIVNIALMLFWRSIDLDLPEFYLVPIGLTILAFVELLKKELPKNAHDPLRYIGALTILVSPVFRLFGESWIPSVMLMVLCVIVILLAIGLRLRALVYTGSAFLIADLAAMVIRSRIDYPLVPWICGILLGVAVIGFAAFCENHREKVLSRIRLLSAELATWK